MKNLSQFKQRLKVGTLLETTHARLGSFGIRPVSIVQTNSFALATEKPEGIVNSWCEYPKAKDIEFPDENTVEVYWEMNGNREKVLTYSFVE